MDGFHSPTPASQSEGHYWRLPSTDPRDEGKFLFRLHTVDIYFWTAQDADTFIEAARKTLKQEQLDFDTPPSPAPHPQVMSPVVQQLENVAITDPAYHNGQTRNSRTDSVAQPSSAPTAQDDKNKGADFTPLAYNPAAPPAPEVIKHREKTPPPPEAAAGTGLAAAAYHDQMQTHAHQTPGGFMSPPPGTHLEGYPGSPQSHNSSPYSSQPSTAAYGPSPTVSTLGNRASSVSSLPPPPLKSAGGGSNPYVPHTAPSFVPPPAAAPTHPYGPGTTPMETPTTQILGDSYVSGPPQPLAHLQPQYADYLSSRPQPQEPVGGYSDYRYDQPSRHHSHSHSHNRDHAIHNQVYRPTEEEMHGKQKPSKAGPGQKPGKLEARAEKAEKGVNRFLRRLEDKLG